MNIGHLLIQPQVVHRRLYNEEAPLADLIEEFATRFVENISKGGSGSARTSVLIAFKTFWAEHRAAFESWREQKIMPLIQPYLSKSAFFKEISFNLDGLWKLLNGLPDWIAQLVQYLQPEKLEQYLKTIGALLPNDLNLNTLLETVKDYAFDMLKKLEAALASSLLKGDRTEDSFVNYAFSVQLRAIRRRLSDEVDALLPLEIPPFELFKWFEQAKTTVLDWLSTIGFTDLLKQYAGQISEIATSVANWFAPAARAKMFSLVQPYWIKIQTLKPLFIKIIHVRNVDDLKAILFNLETFKEIINFLCDLVSQWLNDLKSGQLTIHLNTLMALCEKDLKLGTERCQNLFLDVFHNLKTVSTGVSIDLATFQLSTFSFDVQIKTLLLQMQQVFSKLPLPQFETTPNGLKVRLDATGGGWEKEIELIENQLLTLKKNLLAYPKMMTDVWNFIEENIWNKIKTIQKPQ